MAAHKETRLRVYCSIFHLSGPGSALLLALRDESLVKEKDNGRREGTYSQNGKTRCFSLYVSLHATFIFLFLYPSFFGEFRWLAVLDA